MTGGGIGGLSREEVPRIVRNLMRENDNKEVEIKILPEVISNYYSLEWRRLEFDWEERTWKPIGCCASEGSAGD